MGHTLYAGAFINPRELHRVEAHEHGICLVNETTGLIEHYEVFSSAGEMEERLVLLSPDRLVRLSSDQFICPGFIDLHAHAPQIRNAGLGLDYPLLEWLQRVTFPEELSYGVQAGETTEDHRRRIAAIYGPMVRTLLAGGTTTCVYFGSLQAAANAVLVECLAAGGQRALIGKVCMDCYCPPTYQETVQEAVAETEAFIRLVRQADAKQSPPGRLLPVVTPRFALCCSKPAMAGLAALAQQTGVHVQTHMSENRAEVERAKELFPEARHYADIYEQAGLLTGQRTLLAHCIHLTDEEVSLLVEREVGVAHCPNSNFALDSGIMRLRRLLAAGVRIGLGTDISGGYGTSLLDAMRQAIIASKALCLQEDQARGSPPRPLTVSEALFLATLGGARALHLEDRIGNFVVGKAFDALLVDLTACRVPRKPRESLLEGLQRFVFLGDDRWIHAVFVDGRRCN